MSDSVWPYRRQPTRFPCPWDSPGKNTGVGCHVLLQCMKVKSESEVSQLCLTLHDPMDCSLPGSSVRGIFQARVLEWGATAFSEGRNSRHLKISIFLFPHTSLTFFGTNTCGVSVFWGVWNKIEQMKILIYYHLLTTLGQVAQLFLPLFPHL